MRHAHTHRYLDQGHSNQRAVVQNHQHPNTELHPSHAQHKEQTPCTSENSSLAPLGPPPPSLTGGRLSKPAEDFFGGEIAEPVVAPAAPAEPVGLAGGTVSHVPVQVLDGPLVVLVGSAGAGACTSHRRRVAQSVDVVDAVMLPAETLALYRLPLPLSHRIGSDGGLAMDDHSLRIITALTRPQRRPLFLQTKGHLPTCRHSLSPGYPPPRHFHRIHLAPATGADVPT